MLCQQGTLRAVIGMAILCSICGLSFDICIISNSLHSAVYELHGARLLSHTFVVIQNVQHIMLLVRCTCIRPAVDLQFSSVIEGPAIQQW